MELLKMVNKDQNAVYISYMDKHLYKGRELCSTFREVCPRPQVQS